MTRIPSTKSHTPPSRLAEREDRFTDIITNHAMDSHGIVRVFLRFDIFYCPTLGSTGHDGNSGPTTNYWTNYAANWQVMGLGSALYPIRRLSEFSNPSRTGLMWDACPYLSGPPNRSVSAAAWYHIRAGDANQAVGWVHGSKDPQLRRGGFVNVLFLDGHVEAISDPGDGNYLPIARQGTRLWE